MNHFTFGFEALKFCAQLSKDRIERIGGYLFILLVGLPLPPFCIWLFLV